MKPLEKIIHSLIISFLFTITNYIFIINFIINISFLKYFLIELVLVISLKLYKFTIHKLDLE